MWNIFFLKKKIGMYCLRGVAAHGFRKAVIFQSSSSVPFNHTVFFMTFLHFWVTRLFLLKLPGRPTVLASLKGTKDGVKLETVPCWHLGGRGTVRRSPGSDTSGMQKRSDGWCKELQESELRLKPVPRPRQLSLLCWRRRRSWMKNPSSPLHWRQSGVTYHHVKHTQS